jgi:hypothetical protein
MNWATVATTAATSGVISALVSSLFARRASERAIQIENITKERAKWRDKIREQALAVHRAATDKNTALLNELQLSFSLNLNPTDTEDVGILKVIDTMAMAPSPDKKSGQEFADRVALLLKHDWDRAKAEAEHRKTPQRLTYKEFEAERKSY